MTRAPSTHWLARFIHAETAGGIATLLAAALALILANSPLREWYYAVTQLPVTFALGAASATEPFADWVKDIAMVFFFLLVGMELKRELREGVLADRRQVMLPLAGALGGMVVPALLFLLVNHHTAENLRGWAIPTATDIAFALAVLQLAGRHTPPSLKIFLLAIAIFDDLGAILIIASFYSHGLALPPLLLVGACMIALFLLNRVSVRALWPYLIVGVGMWFGLYHGGVHTTIAGVLVGMAIPLHTPHHPGHSPLYRGMRQLHPWVSFGVLPLFALTSAGVSFAALSLASLSAPLTLGITLGLCLGKQLGIALTCSAMIRLGYAALPAQATARQCYAVCILAGIGFTMSLFIGSLAFSDAATLEQVKLGVLCGSLISACLGAMLLRRRRH